MKKRTLTSKVEGEIGKEYRKGNKGINSRNKIPSTSFIDDEGIFVSFL